MIKINLLPAELRKKEPRFKKIDLSGLDLQKLPFLNIAIAVAGVFIAAHIILFSIGIYATSNMMAISKRYNEILPAKKEAELLKAQVEVVNKKTAAIDELMVKRFSWAKKLNDLSDSMTPGIWLTDLIYEEKVERLTGSAKTADNKPKKESGKVPAKVVLKYLVISGYASSMGEQGTALVGKFIKSLKSNGNFYADFSDIELGAIKSDKIEDQEVMNFRIVCLLKTAE